MRLRELTIHVSEALSEVYDLDVVLSIHDIPLDNS